MHRPLLFNRLWRLSVRQFARVAIGCRRFGFISLSAVATSTSTPGALLEQPSGTIEISPMVAKSTVLSPADPSKEISVVLVLPLKDPQGAAQFAQRVSTPGDELYGKFLTPGQFAAAYGPNEADYAAVKKWATDNGLRISTESVARTNLTVRGRISQFEAIFNTRINDYRSVNGDLFYSAASKPTVPGAISTRILGAIGLTNSKQKAPLAKIYKQLGENPDKVVADGTGPGGAFDAADLRTAYSVSPAIGGGTPQKVALFEQGGFFASDVKRYITYNNLPKVPVSALGVNGSGTGVDDPGVELEAVLDIDMVIGIDPGVKEVVVYEDADDAFPVALLDALTAVADRNEEQVLSISYGQDEALQGSTAIQAENQELTQLAAQGITVVASAGDNGAYGDEGLGDNTLNVADPGSQPFVTCVGGTSLFTYDGGWADEEVWNLLASNHGATGGGVSSVWSIPAWQSQDPVSLNGGSQTMRDVPDVAAVGNPATGVAIYSVFYGGWTEVGGTSVSAPIWAGYLSLINQGRVVLGFGRYGFFNPTLYNEMGSVGGDYGIVLHDIVDGNNGIFQYNVLPGYNAGLGYDNCSGWGSPLTFTANILLTVPTQLQGNYPGVFGGITATPGSTTATISWGKSKGATGYLLLIQDSSPIPIYAVSRKLTTTVSGLEPNTSYSVIVYGVNLTGVQEGVGSNLVFTTSN